MANDLAELALNYTDKDSFLQAEFEGKTVADKLIEELKKSPKKIVLVKGIIEQEQTKMRCEIEFNIPVDVDIDQFKVSFENLSHTLNVDYIYKRIR